MIGTKLDNSSGSAAAATAAGTIKRNADFNGSIFPSSVEDLYIVRKCVAMCGYVGE